MIDYIFAAQNLLTAWTKTSSLDDGLWHKGPLWTSHSTVTGFGQEPNYIATSDTQPSQSQTQSAQRQEIPANTDPKSKVWAKMCLGLLFVLI